MKQFMAIFLAGFGILMYFLLFNCEHEWKPATCYTREICVKCEKERGEKLTHKYAPATCEHGEICEYCKYEKGDTIDHEWADATCEEPETCVQCGRTRGDALGHSLTKSDCQTKAYCPRCGYEKADFGSHKVREWKKNREDMSGECHVCGETITQEIDWQILATQELIGEWKASKIVTMLGEARTSGTHLTVNSNGTAGGKLQGKSVSYTWEFKEYNYSDKGEITTVEFALQREGFFPLEMYYVIKDKTMSISFSNGTVRYKKAG